MNTNRLANEIVGRSEDGGYLFSSYALENHTNKELGAAMEYFDEHGLEEFLDDDDCGSDHCNSVCDDCMKELLLDSLESIHATLLAIQARLDRNAKI